MVILLLLVVLFFGGGGGYFVHRSYGEQRPYSGPSVFAIVLIVCLLIYLLAPLPIATHHWRLW